MSLFKVKKKEGGKKYWTASKTQQKHIINALERVKNAHAEKHLERIWTAFLWSELALKLVTWGAYSACKVVHL